MPLRRHKKTVHLRDLRTVRQTRESDLEFAVLELQLRSSLTRALDGLREGWVFSPRGV